MRGIFQSILYPGESAVRPDQAEMSESKRKMHPLTPFLLGYRRGLSVFRAVSPSGPTRPIFPDRPLKGCLWAIPTMAYAAPEPTSRFQPSKRSCAGSATVATLAASLLVIFRTAPMRRPQLSHSP